MKQNRAAVNENKGFLKLVFGGPGAEPDLLDQTGKTFELSDRRTDAGGGDVLDLQNPFSRPLIGSDQAMPFGR